MNNKKNQNDNKNSVSGKQDEIISNLFLGSLLDMTTDLDNSGQNLAMYMQVNQLKSIIKEEKYKK